MDENEKIVPDILPAEEYEVHSELFTEEEEKIFQEQCRIIKQNIFGDFDKSKACCMLRKDDLINRQRTYAEEIGKLTERWTKIIACRVPRIILTKKSEKEQGRR